MKQSYDQQDFIYQRKRFSIGAENLFIVYILKYYCLVSSK